MLNVQSSYEGESGPEYRVAGHKIERKMGKASLEYRSVCNRYKP